MRAPAVITLAFSAPMRGDAPVLMRGACFRIGADGTLRGPQNDVVARYRNSLWQLPHGHHRSFECQGPVFIHIVDGDGRSASSGPYQFIKAADGAIFTDQGRLAVQDFRSALGPLEDGAQQVLILSGI